jgi:hypothetical protein
MPQSRYCLTLALLCLMPICCPNSTEAQWISPPIVDQCGYQEARCRRDRHGNIVDNKTGNVYDRKGNFIQRGNGKRSSQKRCKYVSDDRCSLYNVNCVDRYYWKCS